MTVYVDKIRPRRPKSRQALRWGLEWCHMFADTETELHEMAEGLGLKRSYFQPTPIPHYDLIPKKRKLALRNGAQRIGTKEYIKRVRALPKPKLPPRREKFSHPKLGDATLL